MRLFLLPISTRRSLIYCQRLNVQLTSKQTYVERVTARAGATWVKWERTEKGWQKKVTSAGNELFRRIPYEEWGLKSIPPLSTRRAAADMKGDEETEVIYPPSIIRPGTVFDVLQKLATERQALHKKWMWGSILGMPVTIPFGLIPVLPNLPFFYLVFRAWSHWRALSGSKHVEFLLKQGLIKSSGSELLSELYAIAESDPHNTAILAELIKYKADIRSLLSTNGANSFIVEAEKLLRKLMELQIKVDELTASPGSLIKFPSMHSWSPSATSTQSSVNLGSLRDSYERLISKADDMMDVVKQFRTVQSSALWNKNVQDNDEERMLLRKGSGLCLADHLGVTELDTEIERAIDQVEKSLIAKKELQTEKGDITSAARQNSKDTGQKR